MTDEELQHIKHNGIMLKDAVYIVDKLIADVQQARKERDWLADTLSFNETCLDPNNIDKCIAEADNNCVDCWLKAAKEAVK